MLLYVYVSMDPHGLIQINDDDDDDRLALEHAAYSIIHRI